MTTLSLFTFINYTTTKVESPPAGKKTTTPPSAPKRKRKSKSCSVLSPRKPPPKKCRVSLPPYHKGDVVMLAEKDEQGTLSRTYGVLGCSLRTTAKSVPIWVMDVTKENDRVTNIYCTVVKNRKQEVANIRKVPPGCVVCTLSPLRVDQGMKDPEVHGAIDDVDWQKADQIFATWQAWAKENQNIV